jgi:hypothetical protein
MFVCCVCCQVEVPATSLSLVQTSPTDCGASLFVIKKPRGRGGHSPRCAAEPEKIINNKYRTKLGFTPIRIHNNRTTEGGCCLVAKVVLGGTDDNIKLKLKLILLYVHQELSFPLDEFN